mgnify:CR=1 FL=1
MQYNNTKNGKNGVSRRKKEESSPQSHTLLFGDFSQEEGECSDGKEKG